MSGFQTQRMILKEVKRFAKDRIAPIAGEIDETAEFPSDTVAEMGRIGLTGILIPEAYGGTYTDQLTYYWTVRELARCCSSHAMILLSHSLCANLINLLGGPQQKETYLPRLAAGEWLGACAMTEPQAGSDLGAIETVAERHKDTYILNGHKHFITNGANSDIVVVLAATSRQETLFNKSLFIVPKSLPGFDIGRSENKMGVRASETTELFLKNVNVPVQNLIGKEGQGMLGILEAVDCSRVAIASIALGIAESAFDAARAYSKQRKQFGESIGSFDTIRFYLAEMATDIECSRLLIENTARLQDRKKRHSKQASMAKVFTTEMAFKTVSNAMQIHGGYGYIKDYPLERWLRDVRLFMIVEGTSEIQKRMIAKHL